MKKVIGQVIPVAFVISFDLKKTLLQITLGEMAGLPEWPEYCDSGHLDFKPVTVNQSERLV